MLLTEQALSGEDAAYLRGLHEGVELDYQVLVPADTERSLLVSVLDGLALGELRGSLEDEREGPTRVAAANALEATLMALRAAGASADGSVTADDPVPALRQAVSAHTADEVQVVTRPHVVEESFHRDWASRARHDLGLPVLHVYANSGGWTA